MGVTSNTSGVSSGSTTNDSTINLTFTASEAATGFAADDITVSGGSISSFTQSNPSIYTAIFTPSGAGATTIDVAGNKFTDPVGNNNNAATQFTWTYDNVAPTIAITSTTSGVAVDRQRMIQRLLSDLLQVRRQQDLLQTILQSQGDR